MNRLAEKLNGGLSHDGDHENPRASTENFNDEQLFNAFIQIEFHGIKEKGLIRVESVFVD
jgi:hypothetical protein